MSPFPQNLLNSVYHNTAKPTHPAGDQGFLETVDTPGMFLSLTDQSSRPQASNEFIQLVKKKAVGSVQKQVWLQEHPGNTHTPGLNCTTSNLEISQAQHLLSQQQFQKNQQHSYSVPQHHHHHHNSFSNITHNTVKMKGRGSSIGDLLNSDDALSDKQFPLLAYNQATSYHSSRAVTSSPNYSEADGNNQHTKISIASILNDENPLESNSVNPPQKQLDQSSQQQSEAEEPNSHSEGQSPINDMDDSHDSPEDFTTLHNQDSEEVRKMLLRNVPNAPGPDDIFLFKPLVYDNFDYNHQTSVRYINFTLRDSEQGLKKSLVMIKDPNTYITNIEHIHFIFFNAFVLHRGVFFKVAWASDVYKVYICSDCEKKLITCKFIYADAEKKTVVNIERRFEEGCFEHKCNLDDIKSRYQKVRLGKYKHERNKLLKKKTQDPTNTSLLIKNLDQNYKERSKETEELFKVFKKEKHSIQKFKLGEMLGDDRRLNFYLHITSFIKVLLERYHKQLNTARFDSAKVVAPILISITIEARLRCSQNEFEECCAMLDISPRETYRGLITKMRGRTERYLEVRSPKVKDEDRILVCEIIDLIGKVTI
ncbi:hypothetical protein WICPIJ_009812 [Wickerhamomyces pijperi]|uniref:Uncharacterized protein n=1 Tax=Wickerhamomyces pijperi TaxID=599730 RepID=A0A9P8PLG6_WICPI|nr:hypothetical protein WICPIJ_009812 [Wickerhamomyces pijperi]